MPLWSFSKTVFIFTAGLGGRILWLVVLAATFGWPVLRNIVVDEEITHTRLFFRCWIISLSFSCNFFEFLFFFLWAVKLILSSSLWVLSKVVQVLRSSQKNCSNGFLPSLLYGCYVIIPKSRALHLRQTNGIRNCWCHMWSGGCRNLL